MEVLNQVRNLRDKLQSENDSATTEMNSGSSDYRHTVLVHRYNHNLETIKELNIIIKNISKK